MSAWSATPVHPPIRSICGTEKFTKMRLLGKSIEREERAGGRLMVSRSPTVPLHTRERTIGKEHEAKSPQAAGSRTPAKQAMRGSRDARPRGSRRSR